MNTTKLEGNEMIQNALFFLSSESWRNLEHHRPLPFSLPKIELKFGSKTPFGFFYPKLMKNGSKAPFWKPQSNAKLFSCTQIWVEMAHEWSSGKKGLGYETHQIQAINIQ